MYLLTRKKQHTRISSNEVTCMCRRTASQAASGAYPTVVDVDGPFVVGGAVVVVDVFVTGIAAFCLACRKAISEQ